MNQYKSQSFFKLFLRFTLIFLIVITLLKIVMGVFSYGSFSGMIDQYFSKDTWLLFVKMQLVLSVIYGVFMAGYYKFIKK
ncbi:hypothetical protein MNBD_BACTEROID04-1702 [hydrothermal vent metagenome]|uniref:Uncharacterized protein n=1 Tax=hydrothermal vent metagenome TaxID=652676 RepID=A0A3B0UAQ1_9ZZZZ